MTLVATTLIRHGEGDKITEYDPGESIDVLPQDVKDELVASGSAVDVQVWASSQASADVAVADNVALQAQISEKDAAIADQQRIIEQLQQQLSAKSTQTGL